MVRIGQHGQPVRGNVQRPRETAEARSSTQRSLSRKGNGHLARVDLHHTEIIEQAHELGLSRSDPGELVAENALDVRE